MSVVCITSDGRTPRRPLTHGDSRAASPVRAVRRTSARLCWISGRAIIVDYHDIAKIDPEAGARGQREAFAMIVEGRINQTADRGRVALLGGLDMMAAFITQMHGVAQRAGLGAKLSSLCTERWEEMP